MDDDTPERRRAKARGKARLKALGIDVDQMSHDEIRRAYEAYRTAYIDTAESGRHMEPVRGDRDPLSGATVHARWGMLVQALEALYGRHPHDWPPARIAWPTHRERQAGARGK